MCMKHDARKLTHQGLTELRQRAVSAILAGKSPKEVAEAMCVGRSTVFGWIALYNRGGWDALAAKKRGGRPPKLTGKQIAWLYKTITMKDPRQLKFAFALWSLAMIKVLIKKECGVDMSKWTICKLLRSLGLSPQRPLWRAYQKDPEMVERWMKKEYPKIRRLAKRDKAEIYFGDEAGVRSDAHAGTTWAPVGKTPVVITTGARFGLNIISAISAQGRLRFMVVKGRINAGVFVEYMRRLIHGAKHPVFLIVDGHPVHKSAAVRRFVESTGGMLRLFILPPYSPELNPDEFVWNDLKTHGVGRKAILGPDHLETEVRSHMMRIQRDPEKVRSFFRAEFTAYAA
jgi:transposase